MQKTEKNRKVSVFQEVMGVSPTIKIIELFLEWKNKDLTITDIAKSSKAGRARTYEIVDILLSKKIIIETKKTKKSKFFRLNKKSDISKELNHLFKIVLTHDIKNSIKSNKSII